MKARLPDKYRSGRAAENYRATRLIFLIVAYCLNREFGFGMERINRLLLACDDLIAKIGGNRQWADELAAWADKRGINW